MDTPVEMPKKTKGESGIESDSPFILISQALRA